ncbi:MAG: preprotein translocase subunit SecE [Planctomycetaceae bacterium]
MARVSERQSYWGAFASTGLYKKNQGRLIRQLTALALGVLLLFGCWTMTQTLLSSPPGFLLPASDLTQSSDELPPENFWELNWSSIRYGVPTLLFFVGAWGIYRLVNYPKFTDFLISVDAEMDKVSWPDQNYLARATGVVLGTMLVLGVFLWVCDLFWSATFKAIDFLRI